VVQVVYHEHDARRSLAAVRQSAGIVGAPRAGCAGQCARAAERAASAAISDTVATIDRLRCLELPKPHRSNSCAGTASRHGLRILYVGSIVPSVCRRHSSRQSRCCPIVELRVIGYVTQGHATTSQSCVTSPANSASPIACSSRADASPGAAHHYPRRNVGVVLMPARRWLECAVDARVPPTSPSTTWRASCVLVSDLPGWRDMFVERATAWRAPPKIHTVFAAALRWLIDHPTDMRAMANVAPADCPRMDYETQFAPCRRGWILPGTEMKIAIAVHGRLKRSISPASWFGAARRALLTNYPAGRWSASDVPGEIVRSFWPHGVARPRNSAVGQPSGAIGSSRSSTCCSAAGRPPFLRRERWMWLRLQRSPEERLAHGPVAPAAHRRRASAQRYGSQDRCARRDSGPARRRIDRASDDRS